jgi:hypothetical protein
MEWIFYFLLGSVGYMLYREWENQKTIKTISEIICRDYIVHIEIEQINGQLFAYNKVTRAFLAQASDFEKLKEAFALRFPEKFGIFLDNENVTIDVVGPGDAEEIFLAENN